MKLVAYLPCYNEEENIDALIDAWNAQRGKLATLGWDLEVVGIDDHSSDDTLAHINAAAERYHNVRAIHHPENRGLQGGLHTAITDFLASYSSDDLLVLMDGDNTHDPKYIFSMLDKLERDTDCVIASRYARGADTIGVSPGRVFMSDMARYYYKAILRVPGVEDYTCGYRVYDHSALRRLVSRFGDEPLVERSFACMMELLYKLHLTGTRFDEVPFELRYDQKLGESKMNVLSTTRASLTSAVRMKIRGGGSRA